VLRGARTIRDPNKDCVCKYVLLVGLFNAQEQREKIFNGESEVSYLDFL